MPHGSHPAYEIASLTHYGDRPFHDVVLLGGRLYLGVVSSFVEGFRNLGHITKAARIVEINGPIGWMRHTLRAWLDEAAEFRTGSEAALNAAEGTQFKDSGPSP